MVYDTLASCVRTLFIRGMIRWHNALWLGTQGTSPFVNVRKCRSEWSSKSLERKRSRVLDCLCAWVAWVCGVVALSLFPSFFLSFFIYLSPYYFFLSLFFIYISPYYIFSLFFSKLGLTPSWNKDTPWRVGTCSETLSDFPHTWTFVWRSSVQCWDLFLSVFQLQRVSKCSVDAVLMFSGIICPLFFLIVTWNG